MSAKSIAANQCHHINGRGRRCRMLIAPNHDSLCQHHLAQSVVSQPGTQALAAELLGSLNNFSTAAAVNQLLGNLVIQLAHKRIERRDAIAIAYMCQLLLMSLSPLKKELRAEEAKEEEFNHAEFVASMWKTMRSDPAKRPSQDLQPAPAPDTSLHDHTFAVKRLKRVAKRPAHFRPGP
jgi:hypothetical protein